MHLSGNSCTTVTGRWFGPSLSVAQSPFSEREPKLLPLTLATPSNVFLFSTSLTRDLDSPGCTCDTHPGRQAAVRRPPKTRGSFHDSSVPPVSLSHMARAQVTTHPEPIRHRVRRRLLGHDTKAYDSNETAQNFETPEMDTFAIQVLHIRLFKEPP